MSALSLALIMQLSNNPACTVPGMAPDFWPAVVRPESSYNPFALHDDTENRSYYPDTADEAEAIATRLMEKNHSVGVGLSQLTSRSPEKFFERFNITIRQALDACRNMQVGAKWYVAGALSIYNSGSLTKGLGYAQKIMNSVGTTFSKPDTIRPEMTAIRINRHTSDTEVWE